MIRRGRRLFPMIGYGPVPPVGMSLPATGRAAWRGKPFPAPPLGRGIYFLRLRNQRSAESAATVPSLTAVVIWR